jgi:hypothetical protein
MTMNVERYPKMRPDSMNLPQVRKVLQSEEIREEMRIG